MLNTIEKQLKTELVGIGFESVIKEILRKREASLAQNI